MSFVTPAVILWWLEMLNSTVRECLRLFTYLRLEWVRLDFSSRQLLSVSSGILSRIIQLADHANAKNSVVSMWPLACYISEWTRSPKIGFPCSVGTSKLRETDVVALLIIYTYFMPLTRFSAAVLPRCFSCLWACKAEWIMELCALLAVCNRLRLGTSKLSRFVQLLYLTCRKFCQLMIAGCRLTSSPVCFATKHW